MMKKFMLSLDGKSLLHFVLFLVFSLFFITLIILFLVFRIDNLFLLFLLWLVDIYCVWYIFDLRKLTTQTVRMYLAEQLNVDKYYDFFLTSYNLLKGINKKRV